MEPTGESIRVLHVDDEPEFADVVGTLLEREDDRLDVEAVTSASEGVDRLAAGDFDCVVSDYDMPGSNGIEFLETVREEHPELPFILLTANGSEEIASDAISAGVTDYLRKESGTSQYALLAARISNAVERWRTERTRQRRLAAIETAREGISILDDDGEFVYVNERYADLYEYEPEEMIGEHWELIYPDEEVAVTREEILPAVAETGRWHGESTGLRADGTTFPEDHVVSRTVHGDLVCTVRDLSDRRERESELRLKNRAVDEAPVGISIADPSRPDNPLVYVNDRFEALTGYESEEILGRNCRVLQGEGTDPAPVATMREAIDAGESVTVELRNYRNDGTEFWNRVRIAPVENEDGDVTNYVGFQEDVTDRKALEAELREKSNLLEQLFQQVPTHLYVKDTDGRHVRVSDHHPNSEAFLDRTDSEIFPDAVGEETHRDDMQVIETGESIVNKEEYHPEDDTWTITSKVPWYGDRGNVQGVIGVTRTITERKEYERKLQRKNERLEEFASVVSHDLRNPLNVAEGRLALARAECDTDHDHLDAVAEAHDRMGALIDDLLTLTREGRSVDETTRVDLAGIARACWQNVETADATLVTDTDRTIRADRERFQQLLENLIRNAVEHGGEDVTITVSRIEDGDGFYVADDGSGIPEDERDRVFESGYSTTGDGTGLGLSIVTDIAEAHGWDVTVTGRDAGGTRFEITGVDSVSSTG